jgi:hypothetical protein
MQTEGRAGPRPLGPRHHHFTNTRIPHPHNAAGRPTDGNCWELTPWPTLQRDFELRDQRHECGGVFGPAGSVARRPREEAIRSVSAASGRRRHFVCPEPGKVRRMEARGITCPRSRANDRRSRRTAARKEQGDDAASEKPHPDRSSRENLDPAAGCSRMAACIDAPPAQDVSGGLRSVASRERRSTRGTVGAGGFEPPTSWSQTTRANQTAPRPARWIVRVAPHDAGVRSRDAGRRRALEPEQGLLA